ncbi:Tagatose-6-phosphate kinase [Streptomyces alboniger]
MILTVTPNPSLDRTYEVPSLDRGEVIRATGERMDPGGKGVNVSRAVSAAGQRTVAVLPLGGAPGALVADLLDAQGIEVAPVPVVGATRSNIALAESDGVLTKINAPGPELSAEERELLLETVRVQSRDADWIACCGSLPRGLAPQWYAELVARAHAVGARIALDTSGPALLAALRERPDVVKPNAEELSEAVGRPLSTVGDAMKAAEELREMGAGAVLASLGADGQLLVDGDGAGQHPGGPARHHAGGGDPADSSAIVGFLMFVVIGKPIASAQKGMTDWLNGLSGSNAILLGALLGLMMCFDLGGPVNKVAYAFATAGIAVTSPSDSAMKIMAAVMAAGMVPPLAMALATTVRAKLFTPTERENGKAAWVLGASFISEGAIPFAVADPLRVIPSSMVGGAVTGSLSMAFGATLRAPHGGIFVVPLIGNPFLYLIAIAAGVGVTTALVVVLKSLRKPAPGAAAPGTAETAATATEQKQPVAA